MDERGVIQFEAEHDEAPAIDVPGLADLDAWRTRMFDLGLVGVNADGIGYGNVSLRLPPGFLISGTQTGGARRLGPNGYVHVLHADPSNNRVVSRGPVLPSSESLTHGAVYQARADIAVVMHVHHDGMWKRALETLPCTPPDVEAGTPAMADHMMHLLSATPGLPVAFGMGGHQDGLIACGKTPNDTGEALVALLETR